MELTTFKSWLAAYGRAWTGRNPEASAILFVEDGTYQVTPFLEPMHGRPAILEYWKHVARTQEDIQFGFEVLAVTPESGIARWWASFLITPSGLRTKLDGIFLISLDAHGRCKSLREWWHKDQS
jgi:SnoaL-like domain